MAAEGENAVSWVGTTEAAAQLGITNRTLYRLIDNGDVPAYRIGRVVRLKQSDLDAYLEKARITPGDLEHLYLLPGADDEVV